MNLSYKNYDIPVYVTYRNSSRISIRVKRMGINVNCPKHVKDDLIIKSLEKNRAFIENQLQLFFSNEKYIHYAGKKYRIVHIKSPKNEIEFVNDVIYGHFLDFHDFIDAVYKKYANLIVECYKECESALQLVPNRGLVNIRLKSLKTQHGNYNIKANRITLSYTLGKYNRLFIKSVIYHEIAHMMHLNHSPKFYHFLLQIMPDYEEIQTKYKIEAHYDAF